MFLSRAMFVVVVGKVFCLKLDIILKMNFKKYFLCIVTIDVAKLASENLIAFLYRLYLSHYFVIQNEFVK